MKTSNILQQKIDSLTASLKMQFEQQRSKENIEEELKRKLDLLAINHKFSSNYHALAKKLSDSVTYDAWKDKEIIKTKNELDELRRR